MVFVIGKYMDVKKMNIEILKNRYKKAVESNAIGIYVRDIDSSSIENFKELYPNCFGDNEVLYFRHNDLIKRLIE
jgi:hypothetical protein